VAKPLAEFASGGQGNRLWIAACREEVVGSIAIVDAEPGVGQLRWFLLRPEVRGSGLGRRLLEEAIAYSRKRGLRRVFLWSFTDLSTALAL
jgi:N-acetylglutamate synthase-like GNAT family acetyltransferase